jgi:hypothetical protein
MKISGVIVGKTRDCKIDHLRNGIVQEMKKRHADVRINHKGEVEWSAQRLSLYVKALGLLVDMKSQRIIGAKGILRFKMNLHGAWNIVYEISLLVRLLYGLFFSVLGILWLYLTFSGDIPAFIKWSFVGFVLLGFMIDYITVKYTVIRLIKKEIKKACEATDIIQ